MTREAEDQARMTMTPGNARICQDDCGTQGEELLRNGGTTANAGTLVGPPPAQPSSPPTEPEDVARRHQGTAKGMALHG